MDIGSIINLVKKMPKDKWDDDNTIKKVIQTALDQSGKAYTEADLTKYLRQFKRIAKSKSPLPLISMLLRHGITKSQIDDIKSKFKKK
ncbi:MAG TPA: hypothetical protein VJ824_17905 [Bacillota bacterium]|nr:hypothetical protein [Bacillota bacterium]